MASQTTKNWWIQIPGVQGEPTVPDAVKGYIELVAFNLDLASDVTGVGKSPSKPVVHPCSVGLKGDAAAGLLFKSMCGSTSLGSIVVKGLKTANETQEVFAQYTFTNSYVLNLSFAQDMDGGLAIGTFVFVFTEVEVKAFSQNAKGAMQTSSTTTYDLPTQKTV
jgi:type VI protein secretion system component Hcp